MAWALYAGVSYAVSKNFNIDLTYRYLNFGTAKDTIDCNGGSGCNEFKFKDLYLERHHDRPALDLLRHRAAAAALRLSAAAFTAAAAAVAEQGLAVNEHGENSWLSGA